MPPRVAVPARIRSARESVHPWQASWSSRLLHLSASKSQDWNSLREAPRIAIIYVLEYTNYVFLVNILCTQNL